MRRITLVSLIVALAGFASAGFALHAAGLPLHGVSQKGRAFRPGALTIRTGETVDIINDDGDLLHHAYVDAPDFTFDSGDQEPGGTARITFTVGGTFAVLCGIHPKMKLVVRVEPR